MHTQHYIDFVQFIEFTTSIGLFAYLLYYGFIKINKHFGIAGKWWSFLYLGIWLSMLISVEYTIIAKQDIIFMLRLFVFSSPITIGISLLFAAFIKASKPRRIR